LVVPNLVGMDERVGDDVGLKLGDEVGSKSEGFSLGIEVFDVFGIPLFVSDGASEVEEG
jgi:hypothetical protein